MISGNKIGTHTWVKVEGRQPPNRPCYQDGTFSVAAAYNCMRIQGFQSTPKTAVFVGRRFGRSERRGQSPFLVVAALQASKPTSNGPIHWTESRRAGLACLLTEKGSTYMYVSNGRNVPLARIRHRKGPTACRTMPHRLLPSRCQPVLPFSATMSHTRQVAMISPLRSEQVEQR